MVHRVVKGRENINKGLRGSSLDKNESDDMKFPVFRVNITRKTSSDKRNTFMKTQSFKYHQDTEAKENSAYEFSNEEHNDVRIFNAIHTLPVSYINENPYSKIIISSKPQSCKSGKLYKGTVFGSLRKLNRSRRLV
ncbi:hypothetical protein SteCoe_33407 [Stentor coeruleus]|uniref:Uncharacterized protein n=1 Tax=Stentor coeruleus TaxID=5963 RepID=A0A1R2AWT7_9CILI|nr:hypothetical protein SteCoe_33407 [Stentor coeruleus]